MFFFPQESDGTSDGEHIAEQIKAIHSSSAYENSVIASLRSQISEFEAGQLRQNQAILQLNSQVSVSLYTKIR